MRIKSHQEFLELIYFHRENERILLIKKSWGTYNIQKDKYKKSGGTYNIQKEKYIIKTFGMAHSHDFPY